MKKNPPSPTDGMSTFDLLGDIPRGERILIQIFLRNATKLTKKELNQLVNELPEGKRLSPAELKESIDILVEKGWIKNTWRGYTFLQQKN